MFCSQCGKQNADGAKFCRACGAPMVSAQAPGQRPQPQKPTGTARKTSQPAAGGGQTAKTASKKAGGGIVRKIITAALAVTLGTVAISAASEYFGGGGGQPGRDKPAATPRPVSTTAISSGSSGSSGKNSGSTGSGSTVGLAGVRLFFNSSTMFAGTDDYPAQAFREALEKVVLTVGTDGSFSGTGQAEIPREDSSYYESTSSQGTFSGTDEMRLMGAVKATVSVSGRIGADGTGTCTVSGTVNHDEDLRKITTEITDARKAPYPSYTRYEEREQSVIHFRYDVSGRGEARRADPGSCKDGLGLILSVQAEWHRTGEAVRYAGETHKAHTTYEGGSEKTEYTDTNPHISEEDHESMTWKRSFSAGWATAGETREIAGPGTNAASQVMIGG